ncbi:MAG: nitroreductase family protein [Lactobacillales bacterium]|jgi:nitroreductase|nr:nitroreductase family protein [Lactobacillales bacterium]
MKQFLPRKKSFKSVFFIFVCVLFFSLSAAAADVIIQLPDPQKTGGMPLMQAITERKSDRTFTSKKISEQTLSDLLYTAFGVSHEKKFTIPTSMNRGNLKVFVVRGDGTWLYIPEKNILSRVTAEDLRPHLATQSFVLQAPISLVYTGSDPVNSPLHAGSAYQNVGLYCASVGLNNVVRASFDKESFAKELNLGTGEKVIVSQSIGWAK